MNVLDIIKDCINNPCFVKDYDLEECTVDQYSKNDSRSITNESCFSGYSVFKKNNASNTTNDQIKETKMDRNLLRMYMRVWAGLGKIILKEISQGNCFVSLDIGYFYPIGNNKCAYSPTLELIEKYGYTLIEDSYNIHPSQRNVNLIKDENNLYR